MSKKINDTYKNRILLIITAILTIFYGLSFVKTSSKDKREKIRTSLVNPKYKDSITSFELSDASGSIKIIKKGTFWTVENLPASSERIANLIENLIKIRNLYKISDKITQNSSFGLTNGTEFHLRYSTDQDFHELVFGNQDFSLSSRYLMTEKSTKVYEIDSSLDNYLSTSVQSWSEPYLISHVAAGNIKAEDIQTVSIIENQNNEKGSQKLTKITDNQSIAKLFDLRHGGSVSNEEAESISQNIPQLILTFELGNKKSIILKIYETENQNETNYIVISEYKNASGYTDYKSFSKISGWTYNKIKETIL